VADLVQRRRGSLRLVGRRPLVGAVQRDPRGERGRGAVGDQGDAQLVVANVRNELEVAVHARGDRRFALQRAAAVLDHRAEKRHRLEHFAAKRKRVGGEQRLEQEESQLRLLLLVEAANWDEEIVEDFQDREERNRLLAFEKTRQPKLLQLIQNRLAQVLVLPSAKAEEVHLGRLEVPRLDRRKAL